MPDKRAQFGIIFLTILIDMIGFGIVIPVLPVYADTFGATAFQNGLLVGVFSLAQLLAAPLWGRLSDRVGRKPVLLVSVCGTALGFFMMGAAGALWMLFVARTIDGFSGGNIGTAQAYLADISAPEERSKAMGLLGAAFGLGFVIGPALGGVLGAKFGHSAPMYVAATLAVANAILILLFLPESLAPELRGKRGRRPVAAVFHHADQPQYGIVLITHFCLICGFSIMTALFALFAKYRLDLDEKGTGYILALVGTIGVIVQGGLIGRLVTRFGEPCVARAGALILAGGLAGLPFSAGIGHAVAWACVVALGNSCLMPTLSGLASRSADRDWQGSALGMMQAFGSLARWIGPSAAGWLAAFDFVGGHPGPAYGRVPFLAGALLVALAFLFTLRLQKPAIQDR